jgi:ABC-type transport system substrate-binding protein
MSAHRSLVIALGVIAIAAALPSAAVAQETVAQGTFVYAADGADITWDPHHAYSADEAQVFTAIHEGLYVYDPLTLEPTPAIAEKMSRSKDKKTYTFTLRESARFSNGDPILAEHVRASVAQDARPRREGAGVFEPVRRHQGRR